MVATLVDILVLLSSVSIVDVANAVVPSLAVVVPPSLSHRAVLFVTTARVSPPVFVQTPVSFPRPLALVDLLLVPTQASSLHTSATIKSILLRLCN